MEWTDLVGRFFTDCRQRGLAEATLRTYTADLSAFARWHAEATGNEPTATSVTALDVAE